MTTRFEVAKLKKALKVSGIDYQFKRSAKNAFGEPTGELEDVAMIKGLYHEQNSKIEVVTGDTTQVRTKKIPMILCLYEDVAEAALQIADVLFINNKTFKVTGVVDIQEWGVIADISLEVIDDGIQVGL